MAALVKAGLSSGRCQCKMESGDFHRAPTPAPPMKQQVSSAIRKYAIIWLAWTATGLFYISQDFVPRLYRSESVPWLNVFLGWMAAMYICAVFTPAILWLGRRWPLAQGNGLRWGVLHFCFAAVFSIVSTAIETLALIALRVRPDLIHSASFGAAFQMLLVYSFHGGVIRYWAVLVVQTVYRSHEQAREREREARRLEVRSSELAAQLSAAQLSALKMQLHPHFLFNTLSAIMVLVRQAKGPQAEMMLARLSDLLRLTLDDVEAREVPLWRELEFLRLYLSIEQVRFEDRLRVQITSEPEASEALVPHMALQPIVENAVRHGLGQSEQAVMIGVNACRVGRNLVLTVTDDGPGSPVSGFEGKGIGLKNTRNRLTRLYGLQSTLRAENIVPRGVQVTMTLPFHKGNLEDGECNSEL